jgi:hypothetical protein
MLVSQSMLFILLVTVGGLAESLLRNTLDSCFIVCEKDMSSIHWRPIGKSIWRQSAVVAAESHSWTKNI